MKREIHEGSIHERHERLNPSGLTQEVAPGLTRPPFSIPAGDTVELTAQPRVEARCGQNVTMTCDVTIRDADGIRLFEWIAKNKTCGHARGHADTKVVCRSEEKRISLTVLNVMPGDQGDYLCKVRSNAGGKSAKTVLVVPSACIPIHLFDVHVNSRRWPR